MSNDSLKPFLPRLLKDEVLSQGDAERAFQIIMSGKASDAQIGAFLSLLSHRGETQPEILGAIKVMREKCLAIDAPDDAIDCCGTGGDHSNTYNISTAVSFVVAGCGIPVAKHGNRAASSQSGAADILEALGVNIDPSTSQIRKALWEHNICFLNARKHHPAMKYVADIRKDLGFKTLFNILGPLLNPAQPKFQLIGVYNKKIMETMAKLAQKTGTKKAWIVHGSDGLDEITTTGETYVMEVTPRNIESFTITPEDAGLPIAHATDLKGGSPTENADALRALLDGEHSAYRDIVLLNAAAILMIAGKADNLRKGVTLACQSIDQWHAKTALNKLINTTK